MSIITTHQVIEGISKNCEIDRPEAWELYQHWIEDEEPQAEYGEVTDELEYAV